MKLEKLFPYLIAGTMLATILSAYFAYLAHKRSEKLAEVDLKLKLAELENKIKQ